MNNSSNLTCVDYYSRTNYMMDFRVTMFGTFMCLSLVVCVFGIFGNALSIIVLGRDRSCQRVHVFLLQVLAVGDTVFLLTVIGYSIIEYQEIGGTVKSSVYVKTYANHVMLLAHGIDTFSLIPVTVVRYIRVCHPMRAISYCTMTRAKQLVGISIAVATAISIPKFLEAYVKKFDSYCRPIFLAYYNNELFGFDGLLAYKIIYYLITYVLPLLLLFILNLRLIRSVQQSQSFQRESARARTRKTSDKANRVLIVVVSVFIVTQTPFFFGEILYLIAAQFQIEGMFNFPAAYTFLIFKSLFFLKVLNSSTHFIIYYAMGKRFRLLVTNLFCRRANDNSSIHTPSRSLLPKPNYV